MIRIPVVIQTREMLTGSDKGKIKTVKIWCKYLEDVVKYKKLYESPYYRVIDTQLEVIYVPSEIPNTYEEGVI